MVFRIDLNDVVRNRIPMFKCQINCTEFALMPRSCINAKGCVKSPLIRAPDFQLEYQHCLSMYWRKGQRSLRRTLMVIEFQTEEFICNAVGCGALKILECGTVRKMGRITWTRKYSRCQCWTGGPRARTLEYLGKGYYQLFVG